MSRATTRRSCRSWPIGSTGSSRVLAVEYGEGGHERRRLLQLGVHPERQLAVVAVAVIGNGATGARGVTAPIQPETVRANVQQVAEVLFTDQVVAFELTALLLTVAVVGAVVLARKPHGDYQPAPESALDRQRREATENAAAIPDETAEPDAEVDA